MNKRIITTILGLTASISLAQNLTPAQKDSDFKYLASLYGTYYSGYDWKKQLFGFDALKVQPWLDRVKATTTDLDFYEICVEYVASLNDTHDAFTLTSDFVARLGFTSDLYDGVLLIDSLNRTTLPIAKYPFDVGDEFVSLDGVPVAKLLEDFAKYARQGNPLSTKRLTAARLTIRPQSVMPHAADVGESAVVVVKRQNGNMETYTIPWSKTGTPLTVGPVPNPKVRTPLNHGGAGLSASLDSDPANYMAELEKARFSGVLRAEDLVALNGYGSRNPLFVNALPQLSFTRRLGGAAADFYYSGTFQLADLTIGYIRIPSYSPPSTAVALAQLEQEIAFMNSKTDGLIVDEMRNPGGNLCFGQEVARRLIPYQFQATGFALRPYWSRMVGFYNSMINAKIAGAPWDIIQQYEQDFNEMYAANQAGRTVTKPLPLCSASLTLDPAKDMDGNVIAYKKPVTMMIDEFSTSTADSVPGMFQDARRGLLFGMRTNGAGGNNTTFDAGPYTESYTGMTLALQTRATTITTTEFPATNYIENVGVHPDVEADYMTKDNLLKNGYPFILSALYSTAYIIQHPDVTIVGSAGK